MYKHLGIPDPSENATPEPEQGTDTPEVEEAAPQEDGQAPEVEEAPETTDTDNSEEPAIKTVEPDKQEVAEDQKYVFVLPDGSKEELSGKELRDGWLRHSDYTRKSQQREEEYKKKMETVQQHEETVRQAEAMNEYWQKAPYEFLNELATSLGVKIADKDGRFLADPPEDKSYRKQFEAQQAQQKQKIDEQTLFNQAFDLATQYNEAKSNYGEQLTEDVYKEALNIWQWNTQYTLKDCVGMVIYSKEPVQTPTPIQQPKIVIKKTDPTPPKSTAKYKGNRYAKDLENYGGMEGIIKIAR